MTLSDIHANPKLLAQFLDVPYEGEDVVVRSSYGLPTSKTFRIEPEERVAKAFAAHQDRLRAEWNKSAANPFKQQTWGQFIAECVRDGLGIRSGKLAEKLAQAKASRPDLYPS